jgi:hypothetical protein
VSHVIIKISKSYDNKNKESSAKKIRIQIICGVVIQHKRRKDHEGKQIEAEDF